jgi:CheY-like chemotaxis protein/ketosteroid isomerase-like protein
MLMPAREPLRILVVDADATIRQLLADVLRYEGYPITEAASLEGALALLETTSMRLILADLFVGHSPQAMTEAHLLRRRARTIPMGVLTDEDLSPAEAVAQGFAFLLPKPFQLEHLLVRLVTTLQQPLSAQQQQQAEVVQRVFAALNANDWEALAPLCTADLTVSAPRGYPLSAPSQMQGLSAYRGSVEALQRTVTGASFAAVQVYAHPKGLVACYQLSWSTPDGRMQQNSGATYFQFQDDQIQQMRMWLDGAR